MWDGSAIGGSSFLNRGIAAAQTIGTDRFLAGQYWNSVGGQAARLIVPFVDSYANYRMGEPVSPVSLMMDTLSIIPFGSIAGGVSRSVGVSTRLLKTANTAGKEAASISKSLALVHYHPNNYGFIGKTELEYLYEGAVIGRYGPPGSFFAPSGTPRMARSIPYDNTSMQIYTYRVNKPFMIESGISAPGYGQPGGGIQYRTLCDFDKLLKHGFVEEL